MVARNPKPAALPKRPPAATPEEREAQLTALAIDRVQLQIEDGTVSAQVLTHYLRLADPHRKLDVERKRLENELLEARVEAIRNGAMVEELYGNAIEAFRGYRGNTFDTEVDDDY